jgi:Flp pilus assembly protein TadD
MQLPGSFRHAACAKQMSAHESRAEIASNGRSLRFWRKETSVILGGYPEALKLMERAAALEPKNSEISDHLGDAYWRTGRQDEARKSWDQALSLKPDPADVEKIKGKIERGLEK